MQIDSLNIIIDREVKGTSDKMRELRTVIAVALIHQSVQLIEFIASYSRTTGCTAPPVQRLRFNSKRSVDPDSR